MRLYAIFYANSDPAALLVRGATRRPGQPWDNVPSHCAALFGPEFPSFQGNDINTVFEYVVGGWHTRPADSRDTWRVPVAMPFENKSLAFAQTAQGRYDWDSVLSWLINDHLPPGLRVSDAFQAHYDCSRFVAAVCHAGGLSLPPELSQDCPSPNDLLRWLSDSAALTGETS